MARTTFFLAILFATAIRAHADEPVKIPLKDIWAYDMPDTKKLTDGMIESKYVQPEGEMISEIRRALQPKTEKQVSGEAFVIDAPVSKALPLAHRVFVQKEKPKSKFKSGSELTLVFYTLMSGQYVLLKDVSIAGRTINVQYDTVRHETLDMTEHFALIPLGKLPVGKYNVELSPIPKAASYICKPCSFEID